jgi:hypothetical protein
MKSDFDIPEQTVAVETGQSILCREVPAFSATNLDSVSRAFQHATLLPFRQAWRETSEPDFLPGTVRVGWRGKSLLVFAEMTDDDIFNNATGFNQQAWMLGDAFEIFLWPTNQRDYFELHVTPNNHRLQLRHRAAPVRRDGDAWQSARVRRELFQSKTWVRPDAERWFVYAEIFCASTADHSLPLAGNNWKISFGRYDYSRSRREPVISSTSNHAEPDFHRQQEWPLLNFEF